MAKYDENIGVLFAHICKAQRNLAEAEFNKLGLHVGQELVLLSLMDEQSAVQSDLVTHLCVEPPTLTKMLQRMEKAGLVVRRQDDEDGRVSRVNATARGRALRQPILQVWENLEQRMLANMTVTEQMLLRRLLIQALTNLSTNQEER